MEMLWQSAQLLPFWQALSAERAGEVCRDLNKPQNSLLPLDRARQDMLKIRALFLAFIT